MKREGKEKLEFYVSDEEFKIIEEKKEKSGLNRSEYLRKMAIQGAIVKIDMSTINDLIYEINKIGVNINQIARKVNENNQIYKNEVIELQEMMEEICDKISEKF